MSQVHFTFMTAIIFFFMAMLGTWLFAADPVVGGFFADTMTTWYTMMNMLGIGDWPHPESSDLYKADPLFVVWLLTSAGRARARVQVVFGS